MFELLHIGLFFFYGKSLKCFQCLNGIWKICESTFHVVKNIICLRMVHHPTKIKWLTPSVAYMLKSKPQYPFQTVRIHLSRRLLVFLAMIFIIIKLWVNQLSKYHVSSGVSNRVKMSHHISFCKTPTICKITFLDLYFLTCPIIELVFWYFVR